MKILFNLLLASILPLCLFGQIETDNDNDGMDDAWEIQHQLNPNDPMDAWCDLDGDQVLNLFEFQLDADPRNANSPSVKLLTSSTTRSEFIDLVHEATEKPLLLKLAAGVYDIGFKRIELENSNEKYKPLKLMVQGGWNTDFSEYNPFVYRTIIDGQNDKDKQFKLATPYTGRQITGLRESLIYDGIEFKRGGVGVSNTFFHASYSIYNCSFYDNNSSFYFGTLGSFLPSNIYLVNSTFANNTGEGNIRITSSGAIVNVNMINCTVTNNGSNPCPGSTTKCIDDVTEGIFSYSSNPGSATFNITNSIVWEEGEYYSINTYQEQRYGANLSSIVCNFKNSNVAPINQSQNTKDENFENTTYVNPMFSSLNAPHLDLSSSSPLKEAGLNVGLPFTGSAPDLGVNKFVVNGTCQVSEDEQPASSTEEVSSTIFDDFSWLSNFVNLSNCSTEKVEVYQSGNYKYLLITDANGTATLYNQDGLFYCQNSSNYDCVSAYSLDALIASWTCNGGSTSIPEEDCPVVDPSSLSFFQRATDYDGIYTTNERGEVCLFVEEIVQVEYEGRTYYRVVENFNAAAACPIQIKNIKFYDCKGDFIGGIGDVPLCESPALCNALADATGTVIWAYEKKAESDASVFEDYPWLTDIFDPTSCSREEVEVYETSTQTFVFVRTGPLTGQVHLGDGTLYCASTTSSDCITPYTRNDLVKFWTCIGSLTEPSGTKLARLSPVSTVSVFPNPTTGNLNVQLPNQSEGQHIKVINLLGKVVYEQDASDASNLSIDLSNYEDGMYLLEWSNGKESVTKQIIKQDNR